MLLVTNVCYANLLVSPTRLELTEKDTGASVVLVNKGNEEQVYRISWYYLTATEDGSYKESSEPRADAKALHDIIRFSPKQVKLMPGESQVVRLFISDKSKLPDGEFRTHLLFKGEASPFVRTEKNEKTLSVNLSVERGVSIPVVFKKGAMPDVGASLLTEQPKKTELGWVLPLKIKKNGQGSAFGDLVIWDPKTQSEVTRLNAVAVYSEIEQRTVQLAIPNIDLIKKRKVQILFKKRIKNTPTEEIISTTDMVIDI